MATLNELLEQMGINPADVQSNVKTASARKSGNQVAEFLTKVAQEAGLEKLSEGESQEMLVEAIKALEAKQAAGEQLTPEEQQFLEQAKAQLGQGGGAPQGAPAGEPDGDEAKTASIYKRAEGPSDLDANLTGQEGLMADVAKAVDFKLKEITGPARGGKDDERGGEDNPAAIGNRMAYDNGPASATTPNSSTTTLTGEKAAMARLAKVASYNKLVDTLSNAMIEKMASEAQAIEANKQRVYAEKVAAVNAAATLGQVQGTAAADAYMARLREYGVR